MNEQLPKDSLLPLHCAHEKPVYQRCLKCEEDYMAGKSNGFTPPELPPSKKWTTEPPIVETLRTHFATVLSSYRLEKSEWRELQGYFCGLLDDLQEIRSVGTRIAFEKFELKGELREAQSSHEPPASLWGDGTREMLIQLRDWLKSKMPCPAGDCCNELRGWVEKVDHHITFHAPAASAQPPRARLCGDYVIGGRYCALLAGHTGPCMHTTPTKEAKP